MNSECAIAVVLFVIDILFPMTLIAAQVQFFRNTDEGSSPTEPP